MQTGLRRWGVPLGLALLAALWWLASRPPSGAPAPVPATPLAGTDTPTPPARPRPAASTPTPPPAAAAAAGAPCAAQWAQLAAAEARANDTCAPELLSRGCLPPLPTNMNGREAEYIAEFLDWTVTECPEADPAWLIVDCSEYPCMAATAPNQIETLHRCGDAPVDDPAIAALEFDVDGWHVTPIHMAGVNPAIDRAVELRYPRRLARLAEQIAAHPTGADAQPACELVERRLAALEADPCGARVEALDCAASETPFSVAWVEEHIESFRDRAQEFAEQCAAMGDLEWSVTCDEIPCVIEVEGMNDGQALFELLCREGDGVGYISRRGRGGMGLAPLTWIDPAWRRTLFDWRRASDDDRSARSALRSMILRPPAPSTGAGSGAAPP